MAKKYFLDQAMDMAETENNLLTKAVGVTVLLTFFVGLAVAAVAGVILTIVFVVHFPLLCLKVAALLLGSFIVFSFIVTYKESRNAQE